MDTIFYVVIVIFIVGVIGGGGGFWIWYALARPKNIQWKAQVYQLADGIQKPIMNKGETIANLRMSDLRPYTVDTAIQKKVGGGAKVYMLKKLDKAIPVVTADCVEVWGPKDKRIKVLLDGDTCTLIKSGYERKIAKEIFTPMPHDRITMIKTEMQSRKDKIEQKKDAFASVLTYVVIGFWCLTLLSVTYIATQAYVKMSENNLEAARISSEALIKASEIYRDVYLDGKFPKGNIKIEEPPDTKKDDVT